LSAKKRVRQNLKSKVINRRRKSEVKTQIKHFQEAVAAGDAEVASEQFRQVARKLDKVASTSTMHKRTAARKKSRLARKLNSLTAKKG
jgi:small subunit ribosomal protein S20